jgi:very-short-patch-repair endonuclease
MSMYLHNLKRLATRRRQLRANLTPAEARLWKHLQRSQLEGRKFRRQHSAGPYVLDFYCPAEKLAIELDGAAHDCDLTQRHDRQRDRFLENAGIRTLRFQNEEVMRNLEGVLLEIRSHFTTPSRTLDPS